MPKAKVEAEWDENTEKNLKEKMNCCTKESKNRNAGGGEAIYGIGLIGALVYYLQHANSFWTVIVGIIKSLVWPAFLVYHLLTYLKM